MKWSGAAERRVEEYLAAVEKHLAHKPAGVRKDVVAGLRNQIAEALRGLEIEGGEIGLEVVERVLADMDAPETFAEAAVEVAAETAVAVAPQLARGGAARSLHDLEVVEAGAEVAALGVLALELDLQAQVVEAVGVA